MVHIQHIETLGTRRDAEYMEWLKPLFASVEEENLLTLKGSKYWNSYHQLLLDNKVQNVFMG